MSQIFEMLTRGNQIEIGLTVGQRYRITSLASYRMMGVLHNKIQRSILRCIVVDLSALTDTLQMSRNRIFGARPVISIKKTSHALTCAACKKTEQPISSPTPTPPPS